MKINQVLVESTGATVAFAFGRFNPAHQGHIEVWRTVEQAGSNWFIGTNATTLGPNDPLTFEQKSAWMTEIYPAIQAHIVAQTSVLTLAAYIFKKTRKNESATVAYITDATDWAWSGKLLNQYNGVEGAHGYYKFAQITHVPSPRVSSATALRDAARADDKVAFYHASGTDPKSKVAGLTYFDTVKQAVEKYPLPIKRGQKVKEQGVAEGAMPASVIRIKEKIRLMSDSEKKEYFKGKTREQLQQMAQRHGYGENSNVYAKYATQGVAEGNLKEFAPGAGDEGGGEDPYKYPKPESYRRSADFFGQFEADHFDREDMNDATGEFKGYWGKDQIAYFKFNNPAKTGSDDPGMGWYYEPQSNLGSDKTSAASTVDMSAQRKQQELSMIDAFLKSGQTPKPGSQIYSLMKRHGLAEGATDLASLKAKASKISDKIDAIVKDGGRVGLDDPLSKQLKSIQAKIQQAKKQGVVEGQDNPYGYRKGQTVKLNNGTQGRVIDIFNDSIEVLLVGGRTVTVDFRDAQVIDEQGVVEDSEDTVSFREMVDVVDKHYPKYYAELSGSNISDKQFEQKITNAYKKIMQKQGVAEAEQQTVAKTWDQMTSQEKSSGVKGRTVWNEKTQRYYTVFDVPVKQTTDEASLATMRDYFAGDENAQDPTTLAKQRTWFDKTKDKNGRTAVDKRFRSPEQFQLWLKQNKLKQISSANESTNDKGWSLTNKKQQ